MTKLQIDFMNGFEIIRHNKEGELLTQKQIAEQARHNLAQEAETHRANVASESLISEQNAINRMNAHTNVINATTQAFNAQENARANRAREAIQQRQNTINAIQASAAMRQAAIAQQNANTNAYNAQTNRIESGTNAKRANVYDTVSASQVHLNLRQAAYVDRQRENINEQYGVNRANTIINGIKALNPLAILK